MAEAIYALCAAASLVCALLLFHLYRDRLTGLLLWSTFCFAFLALSNVLLFVDVIAVPAAPQG